MLWHTLEPVRGIRSIGRVIIAVRDWDVLRCERLLHDWDGPAWEVLAGGDSRADTIRLALDRIHKLSKRGLIVVHDGARPCASPALWRRVMRDAREHGAAVPVLPVTDTLKTVRDDFVEHTIPRSHFMRAQTPQAFHARLLIDAYRAAGDAVSAATDDAAVVEKFGHAVAVTPGEPLNIKITVPEDLVLIRALFEKTPF